VEELRKVLLLQLPAASRLGPRVAVAVNQALAAPGTRLAEGDEVALLPPVSGGSDAPAPGCGSGSGRCTLSEQPVDVESVAERVAGPDAGGVVSFVGRVRNQARGRTIERLEYEAYAGMAERELEKIAAEAASRWPGARVAVAHRTGTLGIGEVAVVVVAAAPHRREAFEACRFTIDALKQRVPIWKKEVATDGEYWVEDHP
jgi:molybdopterin synthase catalytic subunit